MRAYFKVIIGLFSCLLLTSAGLAQSDQSSPFDLVIFGENLDPGAIEIQLKNNPGTEQNWQKLEGREKADSYFNSEYTTLTYRGLSSEKFAGQDLRENYIAIKIRTLNANKAKVRAIYALPHLNNSQDGIEKIHKAIIVHPQQIQRYSMAKMVYPRPQMLFADKTFTEHIQMPVNHLKPGVQEVRWLDIIFSED